MRRLILLPWLTCLLPLAHAAKPLNVVLIVADDLGVMDVSPYNPGDILRHSGASIAGGLRGEVHRGIRRMSGLLPDPFGDHDRPMAGPHPQHRLFRRTQRVLRRGPAGKLRSAQGREIRTDEKPPALARPLSRAIGRLAHDARRGAQGQGLRHLLRRQVAPRAGGIMAGGSWIRHQHGRPQGRRTLRGKKLLFTVWQPAPARRPATASISPTASPPRPASSSARTRPAPSSPACAFYSVHTPLMGRPDLVEKYEKRRARRGLDG